PKPRSQDSGVASIVQAFGRTTGRFTPGHGSYTRAASPVHGGLEGTHGMNVICRSRREGRARQLNLAHPLTLSLVGGLALAVLGSAFALGLQFGRGAHSGALGDTLSFSGLLAEQKRQIGELRQQLQLRVDAMAMRLGKVNAHIIRLDALGKRLTEMADIDSHEFN